MCSTPYRTKAEVPQYPEEPAFVVLKTPMWKKILSPFVGAAMFLGIPTIIACIFFYFGKVTAWAFHLKNIPNSGGTEGYIAYIIIGIGIITLAILAGVVFLKIIKMFKDLGDDVLGVK